MSACVCVSVCVCVCVEACHGESAPQYLASQVGRVCTLHYGCDPCITSSAFFVWWLRSEAFLRTDIGGLGSVSQVPMDVRRLVLFPGLKLACCSETTRSFPRRGFGVSKCPLPDSQLLRSFPSGWRCSPPCLPCVRLPQCIRVDILWQDLRMIDLRTIVASIG